MIRQIGKGSYGEVWLARGVTGALRAIKVVSRADFEYDRTFERDGVSVVIDEVSLDLLAGSTIDFVEDLIGASFQITNPQATSSCGCGASFSI